MSYQPVLSRGDDIRWLCGDQGAKKMIVIWKEDIVGRSVDWMSIQRIQVQKDTPLKFQFWQSLNESEAWKEVGLQRKTKGHPSDLAWFSIIIS